LIAAPAGVRFGDLVYRRLRLKNPWSYKAPLLIGLTYYVIAVGRVPAPRALLGVLASLVTIAGIAGVAYFINDLTDIEADLAAGKDNAVAGMSPIQRAVTFGLFLVAALAPWLYLPFTRTSALLLAGEFLLFVVYCFPPFRLKERGFLGVAADATYAHALPSVLAVLTFSEMASEPLPRRTEFLAALGAWQLALGMRNIVLHQLADHDKDLIGGNRTLAVAIGPARVFALLAWALVPLELLAFGAFAFTVWPSLPVLGPFFAAHAVFATARLKLLRWALPATLREALAFYLDNFYTDWLPLLMLGFLLVRAPGCWPLAIVHLLLFRNGLRQSWQDVRGA
jgi:1,4-dihydroxy-2-naphthoate octaprenyltransferase